MAATTTMSGAQFDALPYEEGRRWELLAEDLIEVSSATPEHQLIVSNLNATLRQYFRQNPIGSAIPDVEFAPSEATRLRPDLPILLHDRWRTLDLRKTPIPGVPHIAVEVISPTERTAESNRKVATYLRLGVQEVWQILPEAQAVMIYTLRDAMSALSLEASLTTPLLAEWQLSLRELFEL